jgi:hypothetical protein
MKIKVPEGMMDVAETAIHNCPEETSRNMARSSLEAALAWLAENPIVPTTSDDFSFLSSDYRLMDGYEANLVKSITKWQRRMFLAPDPDEPIKDLLEGKHVHGFNDSKEALREAYRRGLEHARDTEKVNNASR